MGNWFFNLFFIGSEQNDIADGSKNNISQVLSGNGGDDFLSGGRGDILNGDQGNDTIMLFDNAIGGNHYEDGDDTFYSFGNNWIRPGTGTNDIYLYNNQINLINLFDARNNFGINNIFGFESQDKLKLPKGYFFSESMSLESNQNILFQENQNLYFQPKNSNESFLIASLIDGNVNLSQANFI